MLQESADYFISPETLLQVRINQITNQQLIKSVTHGYPWIYNCLHMFKQDI